MSPWDYFGAAATLACYLVLGAAGAIVLGLAGFVAWCAAVDLVYGIGSYNRDADRPTERGDE